MRRFAGGLGLLATTFVGVQGGPIPVPNGSFESPKTPYVSIQINSWQKSPKPDGYEEGGGFLWTQLTGIFKNTPVGSADHIDNVDGDQALWLFAVPEVELFQGRPPGDTGGDEALEVLFEPGKSYRLTAGVIGGGGNMLEGVGLEMGLYYWDASTNRVTVASTSIVHSVEVFSSRTRLVDFHVDVPVVRKDDPWAGRRLGIHFRSTVGPDMEGGYWDLDNVRLSSQMEPGWHEPLWVGAQFSATLQSEPGQRLEVLAASDVSLPEAEWVSVATVTNLTGTVSFVQTNTASYHEFFRIRPLP